MRWSRRSLKVAEKGFEVAETSCSGTSTSTLDPAQAQSSSTLGSSPNLHQPAVSRVFQGVKGSH